MKMFGKKIVLASIAAVALMGPAVTLPAFAAEEAHLPKEQWPSGYGIEGHPVPKGYWAQLLYPFRRK